MLAIRTVVWFYFGVRPLMGVMLRLCGRTMITIATLVRLCLRVFCLMVLQLLLCAECHTAMIADMFVVVRMRASDVSDEFASVLVVVGEAALTALPMTDELLV